MGTFRSSGSLWLERAARHKQSRRCCLCQATNVYRRLGNLLPAVHVFVGDRRQSRFWVGPGIVQRTIASGALNSKRLCTRGCFKARQGSFPPTGSEGGQPSNRLDNTRRRVHEADLSLRQLTRSNQIAEHSPIKPCLSDLLRENQPFPGQLKSVEHNKSLLSRKLAAK